CSDLGLASILPDLLVEPLDGLLDARELTDELPKTEPEIRREVAELSQRGDRLLGVELALRLRNAKCAENRPNLVRHLLPHLNEGSSHSQDLPDLVFVVSRVVGLRVAVDVSEPEPAGQLVGVSSVRFLARGAQVELHRVGDNDIALPAERV